LNIRATIAEQPAAKKLTVDTAWHEEGKLYLQVQENKQLVDLILLDMSDDIETGESIDWALSEWMESKREEATDD
jgi:hypothetical protein